MTTDQTIQIFTSASALVVAAYIAVRLIRSKFRHESIVFEGFTGLLYREGKLAEVVGPGRHVRWGRQYQLVSHDMRRTMLNVLGQEVLTSDNAAVKLSLVLTIQIVDAKKAVTVVDNYSTHIYSAAQIALRAAIVPTTLEALLTQRITVGEQLRGTLVPIAETVGVAIHAVEVRDVMLPGDIRKAFTDVLKAKHEGLATLERARSETAALRSLANAARLVAEQPGLATLRFLQTLESGAAQQVVLSDLASFMPAVGSRKADG
jgi:regulator of protease activity HflC (stomatin/prohibitin superfamily)